MTVIVCETLTRAFAMYSLESESFECRSKVTLQFFYKTAYFDFDHQEYHTEIKSKFDLMNLVLRI